MDENSSEQMLCTASYSDGTSVQVSPVWSEDSSEAAIDGSGMLSVGDVTGDQVVNVYADFGGKSKSLSITIVDTTPVLDSLEISGPTVVAEGTSEQFSCTAIYSDGSVLAITPAWSVSPGIASIDSAGLLIAGDVVSDQEVTVSASFGGKTVLLKVLIKYVPPVLSGLTIQGAVSMNEETSVQLNCVGHYSDGSTALVVAEWSENSSYATIDGSGVLSAGNVSSDQNVMVGASFGGYADTHSVVIKYVAPTLIGITVSGPSIVAENSSGQYGCVATYSDGTTQAVVPDWSENSSHASINSSGTLTAGDVSSDQSLTVSATYQGKSDSMPVTIKYEAPTLQSISISGSTSVDEGESTQYTCIASYSDGTSESVVATWFMDSEFAQISTSGMLVAGAVAKDETVIVSATYSGKADTFDVTVKYVPPPVVLAGLAISGPTELNELESISLTCQATYSDGSTETVTPVWSEDSAKASVSASGVLTAGNIESDATVNVVATFGGLQASHAVSVWWVGDQVVYPLTGLAGKAVRAELYDHATGDWYDLGPFDSPEELVIENVNPDQWYWISISESNTTSDSWDEVQANWLHM
ncbi:hypothetical protein [Pontiella desulfatans]|nr:hypothetical protein [Pontiella desulfatans]